MSRKEQAAASRAGLLEAARLCFTELGYEATTVAAILERAGMARGALYHYFPGGKREIFGAVFDSINDAFHRRRDALLEIGSPLERIRGGFRIFLELCISEEFARIALIDAPVLFPRQAQPGSSFELLRIQLEEAAAAGEVRPMNAEAVAIALYGAVRGAGEFVVGAPDRARAVADAVKSLDLLIDGLSERFEPRDAPAASD